MPKINLSVPYNLTQEEAKGRITSLLAECKTKFAGNISDVSEAWTGYADVFSFKAMGFSVNGKLDVQPGKLVLDMSLPLAAWPFKARIESEIVTHARQLLA